MKLSEITEAKKREGTPTEGTYAAWNFRPDDVKKIRKWLKDNKVPNRVPSSSYHCTLLYSRTPCPDYEPDETSKVQAKLGEYAIWKTQDDKYALVVLLDSPDMCKRHKELMKQHNATYDYDEYRPHLTLSYDVGKEFDLKDLPKIADDISEIFTSGEYKEPLRDFS